MLAQLLYKWDPCSFCSAGTNDITKVWFMECVITRECHQFLGKWCIAFSEVSSAQLIAAYNVFLQLVHFMLFLSCMLSKSESQRPGNDVLKWSRLAMAEWLKHITCPYSDFSFFFFLFFFLKKTIVFALKWFIGMTVLYMNPLVNGRLPLMLL